MIKLVVVLWKWKSTGWRLPYEYQHVQAMVRMLDQYLKIPHHKLLVTDDATNCEFIDSIPLWEQPIVHVKDKQPNCYKRLWMYSEQFADYMRARYAPDGEVTHILSIDLDAVITQDITSLFDLEKEFQINSGISCTYNGAMQFLKLGARSIVWNSFDPQRSPDIAKRNKNVKGSNFFGSDQAWISHVLWDEATWGNADGVYAFADFRRRENQPFVRPEGYKIVFYNGHLKPWMPESYAFDPELFTQYQQFLDPKFHYKNLGLVR